METKKTLSCPQGVHAALTLFALNTGRNDILRMAAEADVFRDVPAQALVETRRRLLEEWYAFVHATVVYGLMHRAPNAVVAQYLRTTRAMLEERGYAAEDAEAFIDGPFNVYMRCLVEERQKDCPTLFLERLLPSGQAARQHTLAVVSGVMAMALCAILDKLDAYDIQAD